MNVATKIFFKISSLSYHYVLFVLFLCCLFSNQTVAANLEKQSSAVQVLIVHSAYKGYPWTDSLDFGLDAVFSSAPESIEFLYEYIDTKRYRDGPYFDELRKLWQIKYHSQKIDVIIVCDNEAYDLVLQDRDTLFKNIPIVFAAYIGFEPTILLGKEPITGVIQLTDIEATIDLALQLHPHLEKIVFVAPGAPPFRMVWLEDLPKRFKGRVKLVNITKEKLRDIDRELSNLGDNIAVIPLNSVINDNHTYMPFDKFVAHLANTKVYPVYALWDIALDHGIVGGKMVSGRRQGQEAAKLALQILRGTPVRELPVITTSPNQYQFDWNQLERFNIDPDHLPPDSYIINRPVSFYAENETLVHVSLVILAVLCVLIITLATIVTYLNRAKEALVASESRFRIMIQKSPLPMVITDKNQDITLFNDKFTELFGYTLEDVSTSEEWWKAAYPDATYRLRVQNSWMVAIDKAASSGTDIETQEWDITIQSGTKRRCEFYMVPLEDMSLIIMNDITARKQNEKELYQSKALLQAAMDHSHAGIIIASAPKGELRYINDAALNTLGKNRDELNHGVSIVQYIHMLEFSHLDGTPYKTEELPLARAISKGEKSSEQIIFRTKEDEDKVIWTNGAPIYDDNGTIVSGIVIFLDITKQKRAENALANSQRFLQQVLNSIPDLLWLKNPAGVYLSCNKTFERFFGAKESEIVGKTDFDFVEEDLAEFFRTNDQKAVQQGGASVNEEWLTFAGEDYRGLFETIKTPVLDPSGELIGILGVGRDITDRHNAALEKSGLEEKLRQAYKMEAIGALAGGIAHDFNNILSAIIGYTELALEQVEKGTNLQDDLQEVYSGSKRAIELVQQILTYARKSDNILQPIRVDLIVNDAIKFLRSSIPTTIAIQTDIQSTSHILGNATQLHQVIMNLCTNASHAMGNGGTINLSVRDVPRDELKQLHLLEMKNGDFLEILVKDNGTGIASDSIDSIFDPYFTTKSIGEGTGMGLAVVHGIIDSFKGIISVDSSSTHGTTFSIYLPITDNEKKPDKYVSENLPTGTESILIIDDETHITKLAQRVLVKLGYNVITSNKSPEALELFRDAPESIDLVITDLTMPTMTGEVLANEIRAIRADIPIIICTGYTQKITDEEALKKNVNKIINKPIKKNQLAKIVRNVLDSTPSSKTTPNYF